jgi:hypothetical protein
MTRSEFERRSSISLLYSHSIHTDSYQHLFPRIENDMVKFETRPDRPSLSVDRGLDIVSCYSPNGPFPFVLGLAVLTFPTFLLSSELLRRNIMLSSKAKENIDQLLASLILVQLAVC